jgi:hypothetical protein
MRQIIPISGSGSFSILKFNGGEAVAKLSRTAKSKQADFG